MERFVMKKTEYVKGSLTVEAAYIMPFLLFIIVILISLSMNLHDKCLIQGMVDEVYHQSSIIGGQEEWINAVEVENALRRKLATGLFISEITSIDVQVNTTDISILVRVHTKVTPPIFHNLLQPLLNMEISTQGNFHRPAETIRAAEVILETGSEIKGMNQLKEVIADLYN